MTPFFFSSRRRHTRCLSDWSSDVCSSDLLLHVVDAADPRLEAKLEAVERLLTELHLEEIPRLRVLNKTDLLEPHEATALAHRFQGVPVSAVRRQGLAELVHAAEERLGREKPLMRTYGEGTEPVAPAVNPV